VDSDRSNLIDVLNEQIRCAEAMLGTLDRETRAIVDGDGDNLNAASAEKARLVDALEALEQERRGLTDALQLNLSAVRDTGTGARWHELLALLDRCKAHNQRNGTLVSVRKEQVLAALKLLRGSEPEFYDSHGRKPAPGRARSIGSA
jgi:flagellar biosynthesis/type III secretory pathway chaperone